MDVVEVTFISATRMKAEGVASRIVIKYEILPLDSVKGYSSSRQYMQSIQ
jgi:hypothetical protein